MASASTAGASTSTAGVSAAGRTVSSTSWTDRFRPRRAFLACSPLARGMKYPPAAGASPEDLASAAVASESLVVTGAAALRSARSTRRSSRRDADPAPSEKSDSRSFSKDGVLETAGSSKTGVVAVATAAAASSAVTFGVRDVRGARSARSSGVRGRGAAFVSSKLSRRESTKDQYSSPFSTGFLFFGVSLFMALICCSDPAVPGSIAAPFSSAWKSSDGTSAVGALRKGWVSEDRRSV